MQRAEWRLAPGKDPARLSAHYKLDCDFGTPVVEIFKSGDSNDPVYLCGGHVNEVQRPKGSCKEIRLVEGAEGAAAGSAEAPTAVGATGRVTPAEMPQLLAAALNEAPSAGPIASSSGASSSGASATSGFSGATVPQGATFSQGSQVTPAPARAVASISAPRTPRATIASRTPQRDLTYGNSAKALVDEAIWNLATGDYELYRTALRLGKSAGEAAQAAGGQLAVVHRKICEYAVKFESVLAASSAKIDAREALDAPFEAAMLEIMSNTAIAEAEREAALEQLGALQQCVNRGLEREITPTQAYRIAYTIGERANWGTSAFLAEGLKPAYRAIYGSVRKALRDAVPHAQNIEERLTNLHAAKSELEKEPAAPKTLQTLTA